MSKKMTRLLSLVVAVMMLFSCAINVAADGFEHDSRLTEVGSETIVNENEEITLKVIYSSTDDLDTNYAAKWLQEQTGLKIEWILYPTDAFKERVNVALATGEPIDLIISPNQSAAKFSKVEEYKFAQQGLILPLDEYIENCSTNLKALMEEWPQIRSVATAPDGHIYSIQSASREGYGTYHTTASYKMWINKEWLDNLGLEIPTTTDEFYEVLKAFKEQDANGNGDPDDEIPLSTCIAGANVEIDGFLMNAFTYNNPLAGAEAPYIAIDDEGKIYCSVYRDEYKEGIEWLNKLCEEGLLYADSFTQDRATQAALNCSSDDARIGCLPSQHLGYLVTSMKESDRYQQYEVVLPLTGPNGYAGTAGTHPNGAPNSNGFIPYTSENPEAAFRLLDFINSDDAYMVLNYGEKGVTWDDADAEALDAGGKPASFKTLTAPDDTVSYKMTGWPTMSFTNFTQGVSQDPKAEAGAGQEYILWHATDAYEPYRTPAQYIFPSIYYSEEDNEALSALRATLNAYIVENKAAFITGNRAMSEWESFLAELDAMGMQDYLTLLQKNYDVYLNK